MGRFLRCAHHSRGASRFSRNRPAVLWGVRSELLCIPLKFEYTEVNEAQHRLGLNVQLPLGITVREVLNCIPISNTRYRVNYHFNFGFANGWRGAITRAIMRGNLDAGPVDSLSRLKRAAEQRYTALQDSKS